MLFVDDSFALCITLGEVHIKLYYTFEMSYQVFKLVTEHPSEEETELLAKECENFLESLPGWFPLQAIQRKAYVLGMILPIFIRREKTRIFNFLSAEERGESLHKLFNEFERQFCSIPYKPLRYFSMKKEYTNRINL